MDHTAWREGASQSTQREVLRRIPSPLVEF
jgi:hypothetical protein